MCSGYECSVQWQVCDREVWQRVLGWLSGSDLVVTKEHTQLWQVTWMVYNGEGSTVVGHHAGQHITVE